MYWHASVEMCSLFFLLVWLGLFFVFGKFFVLWKFLPSLQTELPLFLLCSFKYLNFLSCSLIYSSPALWLFLLMWNPRVVTADPRRVWDRIFLFRTGVGCAWLSYSFPSLVPSLPFPLSSLLPFIPSCLLPDSHSLSTVIFWAQTVCPGPVLLLGKEQWSNPCPRWCLSSNALKNDSSFLTICLFNVLKWQNLK